MVVKLPAERVAEILESGKGLPVAPAGKVFKEWVEIIAAEEWGPISTRHWNSQAGELGRTPISFGTWRTTDRVPSQLTPTRHFEVKAVLCGPQRLMVQLGRSPRTE
jgi:hypothetical protein